MPAPIFIAVLPIVLLPNSKRACARGSSHGMPSMPKHALRAHYARTGNPIMALALVGFWGDGGTSHDQSRNEGAKESFAPAPGVVHELEKAEIQRQLLLRDAPVWP